VDVEEALEELVRNAHVRIADVFKGVQEDLVRSFVVAEILLLSGDVDRDSDGLLHVTDCSVKLKGPLRLLRNFVSLAHQVVHKLMSERVKLYLGNHLDHAWNHGLTFRHVQLECLAVLFSPVVVASCFAPLRLAFIELSNLKVLISVSIVVLKNNLSVLIHLLMRLGDHECIFALASQNQEFNCFLLGTLGFAELSDLECTLRQLTFLSEDCLGTLSVIQMVQVKSNDVLPVVGALVSLLSFTVKLF